MIKGGAIARDLTPRLVLLASARATLCGVSVAFIGRLLKPRAAVSSRQVELLSAIGAPLMKHL